MHRDLSELERRPARTRRAQQRDCDRWMVDFNEVRPHDALGGKTPAEVYHDSERRSLTPLAPSYPPEWKVRRVSKTGTVTVEEDTVFVSSALAGQLIGLKQEGVLLWRARFFGIDLGTIEIVPVAEVPLPGGADIAVNRRRETESTLADVAGPDAGPQNRRAVNT